jgi:hypothetical protein
MNPYREPGDRSCIVDVIEDVLVGAVRRREREAARLPTWPRPDLLMRIINDCIGPRLKCIEIYMHPASLMGDVSVVIEGRGGVSCELKIPGSKIYLRGPDANSQMAAIVETILEKLPE